MEVWCFFRMLEDLAQDARHLPQADEEMPSFQIIFKGFRYFASDRHECLLFSALLSKLSALSSSCEVSSL